MRETKEKIYCAGPLFTEKERQEMEEIAAAVQEAGYATFLPQRDGLELTRCIDTLVARGVPQNEASRIMSRAIFALDIYQILFVCDALVANLNGRVPDEGTVAEAAMAWARGKPLVGYKADSRTVFGGLDNPLVAGLFNFQVCATMQQIVPALDRAMAEYRCSPNYGDSREEEVKKYADLGEKIFSVLESTGSLKEVVDLILQFHSTADMPS